MTSGIHVLCVDDDPDFRSLTATALERVDEELDVTTAATASEAMALLEDDHGIDCIVSDYDMTETNGLEFCEDVRARDSDLPFILFTGVSRDEIAGDAIAAGVTEYLRKGSGNATYTLLANRIGNAVDRRRLLDARRERERELEWYRTLVELAPIKLFAIDEDATIIWLNDEYASGFTESKEELIGLEFPTLVERGYYSDEAIPQYLETVRALLSSKNDKQTGKYEVEFYPVAGERRIYDVHIRLLPLDDGEFTGTVHALRDVTQRNRYRSELERQNERLEEFASVVSHDLRNPLNVAQGSLELHANECPRENDEPLERGRWALQRMDELIEDLLSLARHGQTPSDPGPVDIADLVEDAWEAVDTRGATLECTIDGTIVADDGRVRALFENLFRNAIEHGGEDVTITVGELDDARSNDRRTTGFYVADDGPGFDSDVDPETLFEFGYTTTDDGTGFGLAIVEGIADAHGWDVAARNDPDGGARFEFHNVARHESG